jgi:asparagine synthase (glutamine-hydrolysing)
MKADKMTMANSLELRVPFVDPVVFQCASQIPTHHKIAQGTTKFILREAMKDILPSEVFNRQKLGFPVPIRHWLRHDLYHWAKEIIYDAQVEPWINKAYVLELLEIHKQGKADESRRLWTLLVFMQWHQIFMETPVARVKVT